MGTTACEVDGPRSRLGLVSVPARAALSAMPRAGNAAISATQCCPAPGPRGTRSTGQAVHTRGDDADVELGDMASPYTARLAKAVGALVDASLAADQSAAADALSAIEHRIAEIEPRRRIPVVETVTTFRRDCWTCRYCGTRTIALPILRLLSCIYPDRFPYHPHWKAGQVHPAYLLLSTSLDHVHPGGRGGAWDAPDNLVAACWPCNSGKADFTLEEIGWQLLTEAEVRSDWDGLTGAYAKLWHAADRPDPQCHRQWLRGLGYTMDA